MTDQTEPRAGSRFAVLADLRAVRHGVAHVELRSGEAVITALRPDFEQGEPPGRIVVYLSAELDWQAGANPEDAELRLPVAVVIDTGIDQVRLDHAAAEELSAALVALTDPF